MMRGVWGQQSRLVLLASLALVVLQVAFLSSVAQAEETTELPELETRDSYVVMPFENRSGVSGLEWMRVALPFVMAERAEGLAGIRPAYSEHVVARAPRDKTPWSVAQIGTFGSKRGAKWVFTGWIRRPDWKLELGFALYHISKGKAALVAEVIERGEFKEVHALTGSALLKLSKEAGLQSADDNHELLKHESSGDFYAFTLFGRGLGLMHQAVTKADWEVANKTLARTVYIDPSFTEAQRMLALTYMQIGKPVLAKARLEYALKIRPRYASALALLAAAARQKGQTRHALSLYQDVVELRPWDLNLRFELGNLLWELGRGDAAFAQLSIVADAQPRHIEARRALVLIHAARSDNASLVSELKRVAELAPKDVPTKLELAAAHVASNQVEEAITSYKAILELDEKNLQAHKFLGDLYRQQGQTQRAIRSYGLAIKVAPNDPRAYFLLGALYVRDDNDEDARRIYLRAQRFSKYRPEAYNNLGAIELRRGRVAQSIWYLRRAAKQKPRKAGYRYNLALSLSNAKEHAEALKEVDAALQLAPQHVESNYLKGVVALGLGKAEEARVAFSRTLELAPGHDNAMHNLNLLDQMKRRATEGELVVEGK